MEEIYNEQGEIIENPDLALGYITTRTRVVHHDAVNPVQEVFHYAVVREYPNGGKDYVKVIDVPGVKGRDAYDEGITYQVYIPYTEEELAEMEAEANKPTLEEQIATLKEQNDMLLECLMEMSEIVYQ